ncbi:phenylacetate--CoA ligase [Salibacterium salarium]|uniref:Phenylacetate-coenzyme A ligase n=1 Tax=Salibacterium salarium TaxID=284579 RepID=A0A3R9QMY9_9BACI|nr:phenylacetate--CoA ligase PaaK [Salibacterium salarium]RSL29447.1 phenylacetate--CoA ligase [Salibacterium salarium]
MSVYVKEETYSSHEKQQLQFKRLKETITNAYQHVPFYTDAFREANITPDDIHSLDDINKLPFTQKNHFRENYPFGLTAVPMKNIVRLHGSSGTSGKPTIVAYTNTDIANWNDIVARAIYMGGGRPEDIVHNAYGYGLFTGGLGLHGGAEKLGCTTVPVSGGNTPRQITLIQDFQPRVICSTPSYLMNIGESMQKMGIDPRSTSLQYAILGAEPWSEEMRQSIEAMFNIKAMDIYGLSEIIGPGVAMECADCQNGLHIADDHFYPEIIDPDSLEPLPEGEEGELVFTSLTKEALPILRYRTGDISSITNETCACGRTTTRMSRIKGRIDDMLIIRGVNVFPSEIERYILQLKELECHYQILLTRKGTLDHAELQVEVCKDFYQSLPERDLNQHTARQLKEKIKSTLKLEALVNMDVQLKEPETLPRSEGKAKRIIDNRYVAVNTPLST